MLFIIEIMFLFFLLIEQFNLNLLYLMYIQL